MFIQLKVDDFYTYGNVDDLSKYLKKAQTLNTKLELCREKIEQFNMEETAFEWELTGYPLMQVYSFSFKIWIVDKNHIADTFYQGLFG